MDEALAQARAASAAGEVPIGCVIVRADTIVARAFNRTLLDRDPTAHAEMLAIREAARTIGGWRLEGATAYVTLEPCAMCAGALVLARVARVVFGCLDPKAGAVMTMFGIGRDAPLNHRYEIAQGVLEEECARRLRDFFAALRSRGS